MTIKPILARRNSDAVTGMDLGVAVLLEHMAEALVRANIKTEKEEEAARLGLDEESDEYHPLL